MTIKALAEQLKDHRNEINHRSVLRICNLLEGNKKTFLQHIESDSFHMLSRNFENLANESPGAYTSESYKDEYKRNYELLMFYLDKVI